MAADNTAEIARMKRAIEEMLQRVPPSVLRGGLSATKAYKETVKKARSAISNNRAAFGTVQQLYTVMSGYWS